MTVAANNLIQTSAHAGKPTTHEGLGATHGPEEGRVRPSGARCILPRLRAAWETFTAYERAFSNSIWGDVVALICLLIAMTGAVVFLPLILAPELERCVECQSSM